MLRTKFYLGLLPLLLLLVIVGVAGIFVCRELAHSSAQKISRSYSIMIGEHEMREAAGGVARALHTAQSGRVLDARPHYEEQRGRFKRTLMSQSFTSAGTERQPVIGKVADAFEEFEKMGDVFFSPANIPAGREARVTYDDVERAYFATIHALDELLRTDYREMQHESDRVANIARLSSHVLIGVMIAGVLLSLLLALWLGRMFVRPIRTLTVSARALGEGNLEHDVPVKSRDELGVLAKTFNTMAEKLREYREAMTARVVQAQRTMEATLTSTPDPLFIVAENGTVQIRNPAAEALSTLPEFENEFPQPLDSHVKEVLKTKEHFLPTGYEHVVVARMERDERFFLPRILYVADKLIGAGNAAVLLQDVTKFRLLDDAKSNLVGTVSHELKTPLTSLRMAVYLLLEQNPDNLSKQQQDLLLTARDDADRLLRILNDILDLTHIESGTAAISRREVEPRPLLEEMRREMQPIITSAGQRLTLHVDSGVGTDGKVFLDPERIRHVFINLLGNASKYTPEGGEIVLYAKSDQQGDKGAVRFGVLDEGTGIAEKDVPYVFQKFYRAPGQTRKGAGLGLSIAREIVLAHGGTIGCTSKLGEGSDFYFVIPARNEE